MRKILVFWMATFMILPSMVIAATFGNSIQAEVDNSLGTDVAAVGKFTLLENARVTSLTAYIANVVGTPNAKGVIYSDNAGEPDILMGVTLPVKTTTAPPGPLWVTLPFNSYIYLPAGTYWLGVISDGNYTQFKKENTGGIGRQDTQTYSSPISPWDTAGDSANTDYYSIFATYLPDTIQSPSTVLMKDSTGVISGATLLIP